MTVKELKHLLHDMPDDFDVFTEGCDCTGESTGIGIDETEATVIILRDGDSIKYDFPEWEEVLP
jgi:hypothetical protein